MCLHSKDIGNTRESKYKTIRLPDNKGKNPQIIQIIKIIL